MYAVNGAVDTLGLVDPSCPVNWQHPLNRGRAAWWLILPNPGWRGGLTLRDIVRGGKKPNDGTLTNGPKWEGAGRPGGYGSLAFDGTDDYVHCSALGALSADYSIAVSCRASNVATNVAFGTNSGGATNTWLGKNSSGAAVFSVNGTSASGGAVADGLWHRILGVRQGSSLTVYVDGRQVGTNTVAGTVTAVGFAIGAFGVTGPSFYWMGSLDDESVWLRPLSAGEAEADYKLFPRGYPGLLNRIQPVFYSVAVGGVPGAYYRLLQQHVGAGAGA